MVSASPRLLTACAAALAIGVMANHLSQKLNNIERTLSAVNATQTQLSSDLFLGTRHRDVRAFMILSQARQVPKKSIVLIGDSITEGLYTEQVCGLAVLNAGIGGAGVATSSDMINEIYEETKASVMVIALGVNDARAAPGNESHAVEKWSHDYLDLIKKVKRTGATSVLMTVLPVERDKPLGSKFFNARQIRMMNQEIRRIAAAEGTILAESF